MKRGKSRLLRRGIAGIAGIALLAAGTCAFAGCSGKKLLTGSVRDGDDYILAETGFRSAFVLVTDTYTDSDLEADAKMLSGIIENEFGALLDVMKSGEISGNNKNIIAFGAYDVRECASLMADLKQNEYAIRADGKEDGSVTVSVAFKGGLARRAAIDVLLGKLADRQENRIKIAAGETVSGKVSPEEEIVATDVSLRDPCILYANGAYYMYGTGWVYYKNVSGNLEGPWEGPYQCVTEKPTESDKQYWAPEVHFYNGAYYMFTTYHKAANDHRGCVILRSGTPEGPFEMWSDGHVTPSDWDCIDGTLYIDADGHPWMVFVHEWTSMPDNIGRMAAAKLSPDLKKFVSEPVELFPADSTAWATGTITDGPWLYTTEENELLMIWSNFDSAGYAVGIARSENGKIDGKWKQLDYQLFSKKIASVYDGGHGMIFRDKDGQLYLSVHSPNDPVGGRKTLAVMVPLRETGNMLIWDFGAER